MKTKSFIFADTVTTLFRMLESLDQSCIPILKPVSKCQEKSWVSVLNGYGMELKKAEKKEKTVTVDPLIRQLPELAAACETKRPGLYRPVVSCFSSLYNEYDNDPAYDSKKWVVSIDTTSIPGAVGFARATRRSFFFIPDVSNIRALISEYCPDSLVLFALYRGLPLCIQEYIESCCHKQSIPWGIITGRHAQGICFSAAKSVAYCPEESCETVEIKVPAKTFRAGRISSPNPSKFQSLTPRSLEDIISKKWKLFLLHAHGDGAHVNLDSIVLCGCTNGPEKSHLGITLSGCHPPETCKRVCDKDIGILAMSDLQCEIFYLYSCNGFSINGEVYSSEVSIALGAADGFPAAMVSTNRQLAFNLNSDFLLDHSLLTSGVSLGQLVTLKNNLYRALNDTSPFVLFGDPEIRLIPQKSSLYGLKSHAKGASLPVIEANHALILEMNGFKDTHKISIIGNNENRLKLVHGKTLGALIAMDHKAIQGPLTLENRPQCHLTNRFKNFLFRSHQSAVFEDLLRVVNQNLADHILPLTHLGATLRLQYYEMLKLMKAPQIDLFQDWDLQYIQEKLTLSIKGWDQKYMDAIDAQLQVSEFEFLPHYYHLPGQKDPAGTCQRCRTELEKQTWEPVIPSTQARYSIFCPNCGTLAERPARGLSLSLSIKNEPAPGKQLEVGVVILDHFLFPVPGHFLLHMKDKALGKVIFKHRRTVFQDKKDANFLLKIPIPDNINSELHAVSAVCTRGMEIAYARQRFAIFKSKSG